MQVTRTRAWTSLAASAVVAAGTVTATATPGSAATAWAPADTATIHPGVQMYTEGAQCTANFVYTDGAGNVYVGYAAHCAGTGEATDTNGCDAGSLPLGTKVEFVEGGSLVSAGETVGTGTLAYSSWLAMQDAGTTDENACAYNDLALVQVDPAFVADVNPSVPFWGGLAGIDSDGTAAGETVYSYGNSSLRGGVEQLSPKQGTSLGTEGDGWSYPVYTVTPGVPGDSAAPSSTPRARRWARSPRWRSRRWPGPTGSATSATSSRSRRTPRASRASSSPRAPSRSPRLSDRTAPPGQGPAPLRAGPCRTPPGRDRARFVAPVPGPLGATLRA